MKSALARLGIRGLKPELRKAPQLVDALRTPEDALIAPNTLAEIRRDFARFGIAPPSWTVDWLGGDVVTASSWAICCS
jgi:transposase